MAVDVLSNISSALSQTFASRLVKIWNRQAVLVSNLQVVSDGGQGDAKQVAWDVASSGASAASFAEGSDISGGEFNVDPFTAATLAWGQYRSAFQLSNLEINAASRSIANATQLGNLVATRLEGSLTKIVSQINSDMFAGTGLDGSSNPNIFGLSTALAASGSYAGINKGSITEWAGNVLANGGTARPLTLDLMSNLEQLIFTASGMTPGIIVTSPGVFRKYEGLFNAVQRDTVSATGPAVNFNLGGGASNLFWRGIPVIRDRNCQSGTMYMLQPVDIEIKTLPFMPMSPDGAQVNMAQAPSSNGYVGTQSGLGCAVYPLGRTGSAVKFVAETYIQLKVARTNSSGFISDISET